MHKYALVVNHLEVAGYTLAQGMQNIPICDTTNSILIKGEDYTHPRVKLLHRWCRCSSDSNTRLKNMTHIYNIARYCLFTMRKSERESVVIIILAGNHHYYKLPINANGHCCFTYCHFYE